MQRVAEKFLATWLRKDTRKPLVLRGARQVGKSTLVRQFAQDYVISRGNWVIPVEVKSGKSGSLKSLHQFMHQKKLNLAVRFDLNPPSYQDVSHTIITAEGRAEVKFSLISLPLYAVEQLPRIIDEQRHRVMEPGMVTRGQACDT
ncbi:MAG: AAA family ATPase [Desulfocapsa sp.]|nr:AAA family ATPase [Desulfocapsa sp.]